MSTRTSEAFLQYQIQVKKKFMLLHKKIGKILFTYITSFWFYI